MKIQKMLAVALLGLFTAQVAADAPITCTLTSGATILNRTGEKGLLKKNGAYLKAVPTTAAGWNGVTVTKIKNDNPLYDKAVLLTYQHTNSGGFLGFGGDNGCKCANKDIPAALKAVCENSSRGRVLALGKKIHEVAPVINDAKEKIIKAAKKEIAKRITEMQQEIQQIEDKSSHTAADEAELEALESDETAEENAMVEEDDAAAGYVQDPVDLCVEQKQQAMRTSMQNAKKNRKSNDEIEEAIAAATEKMTERCQNQQ